MIHKYDKWELHFGTFGIRIVLYYLKFILSTFILANKNTKEIHEKKLKLKIQSDFE